MSYQNESLREYFSILRSLYHSDITGVCEFGCTSDRTLYNWNMALSNWFRYFTLTIFMCDKRSKHGLLQSLFINSITKKLPSVFNHYFTTVNEIHAYNTRLASKQSYSLPKTRTNFGIFNVRYQGPKIWNFLMSLTKITLFPIKEEIKNLMHFIDSY